MATRDDADERAYFTRRALEEQQTAATCEDNAVAKAHLQMADEYRKRADQLAERETADT